MYNLNELSVDIFNNKRKVPVFQFTMNLTEFENNYLTIDNDNLPYFKNFQDSVSNIFLKNNKLKCNLFDKNLYHKIITNLNKKIKITILIDQLKITNMTTKTITYEYNFYIETITTPRKK